MLEHSRPSHGRSPSLAAFPDPYWSAPGVALYLGDVRECIQSLPERSIHCCATSPPYWGLRDYGTGTWEGGSAECDHRGEFWSTRSGKFLRPNGPSESESKLTNVFRGSCPKCGAKRVDVQIGSEPLHDCNTFGQAQCGGCFVCNMVSVFREVWRVLRDDGVMWLNLGDSYAGGGGYNNSDVYERYEAKRMADGKSASMFMSRNVAVGQQSHNVAGMKNKCGLSSGNLVGIPWRVALALQQDGWTLRSDLPWVKRSSMPESVNNRPCKALEYVFMLTKGDGYYFDMDAVRPTATTPAGSGGACFGRVLNGENAARAGVQNRRYERPDYSDRSFRNTDLWFQSVDGPHGVVGVGDEIVGMDVTSSGQKKSHFATFPPKLIEPLIMSATSEHGCCVICGKAWERVSINREISRRNAESGAYAKTPELTGTDHQNVGTNSLRAGVRTVSRETMGWQRVCGCNTDEVAPCVVLDPFVGSGTTVVTALQLGRVGVGIDLSEAYLRDEVIPRVKSVSGRPVGESAGAVPAATRPPPRKMRG